MKFLVIRFSSIGDIVLTSPVVRCLKNQVAGAQVHFLTKQAYLPVVAHNPHIDQVQVLAHSFELMLHELREERYDYIIDLHHNLRTLRVKRALGCPSRSFPKLNMEKFLYTNLKWNRMPDIHIVDRYLATLAPFGVTNDGEGLDYFIDPTEQVRQQDIPTSHQAGYIGLVIGAAHQTKKYPIHHLQAFCRLIDHPVILLGGPEDAASGEKVAAVDPVKVYNACGKFSLNESADLVRRAKVVVSNDTGLMHIAAAFKRPIVSLWGNTVPAFGMYPYYGERFDARQGPSSSRILQVEGLRCRPCSKIGYDRCPRRHFRCMEEIAPGQVAEAVRTWL
ncbi:MAG TPA: glycosyltransferase family 9 protein [Chitinophagaceae bacterium]|nr:glycosyltransferase family 9 protein [Chitinophagaceae bacterium]